MYKLNPPLQFLKAQLLYKTILIVHKRSKFNKEVLMFKSILDVFRE